MRDLRKSVDYLLIFVYDGRAEIGVCISLCVCVCDMVIV